LEYFFLRVISFSPVKNFISHLGWSAQLNHVTLALNPTSLKHSSEQYIIEGAKIMDAIEEVIVATKIPDEPNYDGLNSVQQLEAQCRLNKLTEWLKATNE